MKKILVGIVVISIIIGILTLPCTYADDPNDELDQYQLSYEPNGFIIENQEIHTQSFRPRLTYLSKVELFIFKTNDSITVPLTICIKESINGSNITYTSVASENIPTAASWWDFEWVEFDFPDVKVEVNKEYFIFVKGPDYEEDYDNFPYLFYSWAALYNKSCDYYINGSARWGYIPEYGWFDYEEDGGFVDTCFKTYGYTIDDDISISSINNGFGINSNIINMGTATSYNVNWSIDIEASIGLILSGSHTENVIDELVVGESVTIQSDGLRGIGIITITIQAADAVKYATAFLLGPLVLRVVEV
jgi:hypothetical protein